MERKRYRLKAKEGNIVKINKKKLKFNIPVTEHNMTHEESADISSNELNAILIRIKGSCQTTPIGPVISEVKGEVILADIGFDIERFKEDPLLLICIFNDCEALSPEYLAYFKCLVAENSDYSEAVLRIRNEKTCDGFDPNSIPIDEKKPKEQDGDVIGGNQ